jgi:hypothetical protein
MKWFYSISFAVFLSSPLSFAIAQEAAPDKSAYHLFNPTPREMMRELSPDRPDTTESPLTVDAGHFQIEMSVVDYTHDESDGERVEVWGFADTNLKMGLTHNMDLQFVFTAYGEESFHGPAGVVDRARGFSDLTIRWKTNLWGNDGGDTALGLMPFIVIPTETDLSTDEVEGGLIIPFAFTVIEELATVVMAEIDAVHDPEDGGYDAEFVHTATCGFSIAGPLGGFVEYVGILSSDADADYLAYFDGGLVFEVTEDWLLDVGMRVGLNSAAEDIGAFAGFTFRY